MTLWALASAVHALPQRVVVSGCGPAGILAALSVLNRLPDTTVSVFDRRADPRTAAAQGLRAYSLGLNVRGRTALHHWEGMWDAVAARGVQSSAFYLHAFGRPFQLRRNAPGSVPTLLIARDELCAAMLAELVARHGETGRLDLRFAEALSNVDLSARRAVTSTGAQVDFDCVIGADGVNSVVRPAMGRALGAGFLSEAVDLPGRFKVFVQPCPSGLAPDAVHAMGAPGYSLFVIPRRAGEVCVLLSWGSAGEGRDDGEAPMLRLSDTDLRARIASDLPRFGELTDLALEQLRRQRPSKATTIRCSQYHGPGAVLLGDAAHSTGGALGQGCNSALMDAVVFDELLAAMDPADDLAATVGPNFSAQQQPQGLALWQLLQLPPRGWLGPVYVAAQALQGACGPAARLLGRGRAAVAPIQTLLSETTVPFTDIATANDLWLRPAMASAPGRPLQDFALNPDKS